MEMVKIAESYEAAAAARRAAVQTARNFVVISTIFKPIIKIGGEKVERRIHRISAFWAAADTGRFSFEGKKYRLKLSRDVFHIVAA